MSDNILSNRWTVYYESETRQKRIKRNTGTSPSTTDTVRDLYSALMDLFDSTVPASEGTPMKYDTPVQYKIGIIDAGDKDPWYIDRESVEYLTGGSLETVSWARVEGSNVGIVTVHYTTNTSIVVGDIGMTVTHSDGDSGTLLDIQETLKVLVIRPASYAAANNWDSTSGTITVNGHTASQTAVDATETGEQLWANIYTTGLATLQDHTVLGVFQDGGYVTKYKGTVDWWGEQDIDLLIALKDASGTLTDGGYLTVQARRGLTTYATFITNVSAGGRNPIPLTCGIDLNNTDGYRQMVLTDASGAGFVVGDEIYDSSDATIRGIVTYTTGTAPAQTIQYYLTGGLDTAETPQQKDFSATTGTFTNGSVTATAVAPTDVNAAAVSGCTITHGYTSADINEDGSLEYYSITIACNSNSVRDVYEWSQYITRFGGTTTTATDGIQGQQYIGSDYRLVYTGSVSGGTIDEGDTVVQATSGATGTVVAHNTTQKYIILRNSRGVFSTSYAVTSNEHSGSVTPDSAATAITPNTAAPYGTFAGGKWFTAPGVLLSGYAAGDINNFQLTDDFGNTVAAPLKVTATVGNTRAADWVAVFELTAAGGVIKKDTYTVDASTGGAGSTSIIMTGAIQSKVPGKTAGGILRLVDATNGWEYRYRYASWSGSTFTLWYLDASTATGGDIDTLVDSTATFVTDGVKKGDIVYNSTEGAYAYVVSVDSETQLTTTNTSSSSPITDWNGDSYRIGVTAVDHDGDSGFVPFIDTFETTGTDGSPGSEAVSVTYTIDIPVRIRARQYTGGGSYPIIPFSGDALIQSTGMNVNVIRNTDTVAT